jgi:hypothetical protein
MATKKTKKDEVKQATKKTCLLHSDGNIELFKDFDEAIQSLIDDCCSKEEIENDFDFYVISNDCSLKRVANFKLIPKGFDIEDVELEESNDEE